VQRARILAAVTEVAAEDGVSNTTVAGIVARGGMSRRTFYELFKDRDECFLAALDDAIARASEEVLQAYRSSVKWADRVRAALIALLRFLDENPRVARIVIVESLGAGPRVLERRGEVVKQLVCALDEGRDPRKGGGYSSPVTAEGVVGAVLAVIHARILDGPRQPLLELTSPLMATIVLPYLGSSGAKRELARPAPTGIGAGESPGEPLKDLEMRLTYRTLRTLLAIGANPGASNRQIGAASGVEDQGQISKLLARLERLGMIHNAGPGPTRGASNAWTLTARGEEVRRALSASNGGA
jgi:AcrR family transcriptional regulator/DNA-binding MarR family transcriptional regulator